MLKKSRAAEYCHAWNKWQLRENESAFRISARVNDDPASDGGGNV